MTLGRRFKGANGLLRPVVTFIVAVVVIHCRKTDVVILLQLLFHALRGFLNAVCQLGARIFQMLLRLRDDPPVDLARRFEFCSQHAHPACRDDSTERSRQRNHDGTDHDHGATCHRDASLARILQRRQLLAMIGIGAVSFNATVRVLVGVVVAASIIIAPNRGCCSLAILFGTIFLVCDAHRDSALLTCERLLLCWCGCSVVHWTDRIIIAVVAVHVDIIQRHVVKVVGKNVAIQSPPFRLGRCSVRYSGGAIVRTNFRHLLHRRDARGRFRRNCRHAIFV
mmetsp:Transcript_23331/g.66106  ORF Transcript_23331/g.66106 Transcript_23331/m.66106 type:complete len:281 (+) Transcript_23331:728-1570(+)